MSPHTCSNSYYQKDKITSVGQDVDKRELPCTVCRNVNCIAIMKKVMEVPQKLKIELPYDPETSLLVFM